ncbi:hypothetical protein F5876DRAFT_24791, partial [Lentinula aff. lateritia]
YSVSEDLNNPGQYTIEDEGRNFKTKISSTLLMNLAFNLPDWYKKHLKMAKKELQRRISGPVEYEFLPRLYGKPTSPFEHELDQWVSYSDSNLHLLFRNLEWEERHGLVHITSLAHANIEPKTYPGLQRNSGTLKEVGRLVPRPIVIVVKINDKPVRALVDSGSLGDFMSTNLSDQLKVVKKYMPNPLRLNLGIQGSRSKIHCGT